MVAVKFFFLDTKVSLSKRTDLKRFLMALFKKEKIRCDSLTYIFCTDEHLLQINKQFLNHNYFTDIITFNLSQDKKAVTGEIYISIDRVKENAVTLKETFKRELHRVIFHGALHLCGYKDKTASDKIEMTRAEERCLAIYFR